MKRLALILGMLFFSTTSAHAEGCYDERPIVDKWEVWDFSQRTLSSFWLPTRTASGKLYQTYAAAHFEWNKTLNLNFIYQLPEGQTGLEYNVYRADIQVGHDLDPGKLSTSVDFTKNCALPGRSMFSGQSIQVKPIKVPLRYGKEPRGKELVHILVWGHL
jgi:hypothetical protein